MRSNMVEVDETYVGVKLKNKHKKKRAAMTAQSSHGVNKTAAVGLLERNNKVRITVWNPQTVTLKIMLRQHVSFDTIICTDGLTAYKGLNAEYAGYEVVNHDKDEYVRGTWHTNSIEDCFSILKLGIYGIYHQVSPKHLQHYCAEFAARYNSRDIKDHKRFTLSLRNSEGSLKYTQLIAK